MVESQASAQSTVQEVAMATAPDRRYARVKSAVGWMYAIPGVSLLNALAVVVDIPFRLVVGLVSTDFIMAFGREFGVTGSMVALVLTLLITGAFFALALVFKKTGRLWAPTIVVIVYALDLIPSILFKDYFGAAFHVAAIYFIAQGAMDLRSLARERVAQKASAVPAIDVRPDEESSLA